MNHDPIDDLLDGQPSLPDDGFTRRVMAALPPARPAGWPVDRWLPLLAAGLVAAALAPEAAGLARLLGAGSATLVGGLAQALSPGAAWPPLAMAWLAAALALAAAALGSWLVAEPS
jgi:hypothetical protein